LVARLHPRGGNDSLVRIVEFRNSQLSHIPAEFFAAFPGILTLNAASSNLRSVGVLRNCQNLLNLNINNNLLKTLPTRSISSCYSLASINVQNNQITDLEPGLLRNFRNLQTFQIQNNQIRLLRSRALLTATTRTALNFRFGNNPIFRIEGGFNKTANFANLWFDNCRIDEVDRNFLNNVVGDITMLNMTGNLCIDTTIANIHGSTIPGVKPFFHRCFLNFDQARTTRPSPPTAPATTTVPEITVTDGPPTISLFPTTVKPLYIKHPL
jgi:hypothetical protein